MKDRPNFLKALKRKTSMKIRVTPAISRKLQKIALENGITWINRSGEITHTDMPYIFFDTWGSHYDMPYAITHADDETFFNEDPNKEYIPATDTLLPKPRKKIR